MLTPKELKKGLYVTVFTGIQSVAAVVSFVIHSV
jgi:hypothetical protein